MRLRAIFIFLLFAFTCNANNLVDSTKAVIRNSNNDSVKIVNYARLGYYYMDKPAQALEIISEMKLFVETIKSERNKAIALRKVGLLYHNINLYDYAIEFYLKSATLSEKINDQFDLANCYNNIGNAYVNKGSLTSDLKLLARSIEYHEKSLEIRKKLNDTLWIVNTYNNLGNAYTSMKEFEKGIAYFNLALIYYNQKKLSNGAEMATLNLGEAYLGLAEQTNNKANYQTAAGHFENVIHILKKGVKNSSTEALIGLGVCYANLNNLPKALQCLQEAKVLALSANDKNSQLLIAEQLSKLYEQQNDLKNSILYMHEYNTLKNELVNEKNNLNIEHMNAVFQSAQKEAEILNLNKEKAVSEVELKRQKNQRNFFVAGFLLVVIFSMFIFRSYRIKRRDNLIIASQKEEVEKQKALIEEKQKEVMDSITYARRIQRALITNDKYIEKALKRLNNN